MKTIKNMKVEGIRTNYFINSFSNKYQEEKQVLRDGSNFVFESVDLMSYHIHKTSLKRGSSYVKSPKWIANKKL